MLSREGRAWELEMLRQIRAEELVLLRGVVWESFQPCPYFRVVSYVLIPGVKRGED